ncbi:hypothetical protein H6501_05970 [Candidatus Woesearchaeota archaeon]|nr:hypothetical protein [Candidatus Woesearchaeota archaeon]
MFIGNRYTSHLDVFNTPHYRTHKIAQSLSKLYEKVVIVLLDYKTKKFEEKTNDKIHIISIPFTPRTIRFARKQLNMTVEKYNINTLVFSNGPLIATSYLLFKKKKVYTLVYEVLDNYKTFFSKKLFFSYPLINILEIKSTTAYT